MFPSLFNKNQTPKIRFLFNNQAENRKRLTWDDLETIEKLFSGEASTAGLKSLAARFMADDKDQYLPHEQAVKALGKLAADDIQDVLKRFVEAINGAAVNPQSGNGSNLPFVAGQAETLPHGQQP